MPCFQLSETMARQLPPVPSLSGTEMFNPTQFKMKIFFTKFRCCHTPIRNISGCTSEKGQLMWLNIFTLLCLNLLSVSAETKNLSTTHENRLVHPDSLSSARNTWGRSTLVENHYLYCFRSQLLLPAWSDHIPSGQSCCLQLSVHIAEIASCHVPQLA